MGREQTLVRLSTAARRRLAAVARATGLPMQDVVDLLFRYTSERILVRRVQDFKADDAEAFARWAAEQPG